MGMGSLSDTDDDFNPEINTTPLVDVMLVLLIIFIITIPVINHSVKIDPQHYFKIVHLVSHQQYSKKKNS